MREWSRNDAEAATKRYAKAAAKDYPTACTTGRISVKMRGRVTAPIEPPDHAELMTRYMLATAPAAGQGLLQHILSVSVRGPILVLDAHFFLICGKRQKNI